MPSDRDTPEFRARAEVRSQRQQVREAQTLEREREEVARLIAPALGWNAARQK